MEPHRISSTREGTTGPWGRAQGSHTPGPLAPGSPPERTIRRSPPAGGSPACGLGGDSARGAGSLALPQPSSLLSSRLRL